MLTVASLTVVLGTGPASADGGTCTTSGATRTCVFGYTGAEQTFTVPANVSQLQVTAIGAAGGTAKLSSTPGGQGARVTGNLAVTSGSTLYVEVGGTGENASGAGGFNGGGASGYENSAGAGGGASDVRTTARAVSGTLDSRLIVAGGGGGVGEQYFVVAPPRSGDAGTDGAPATQVGLAGQGGKAGGPSEGGEGGKSATEADPGGDGTKGQGGNGVPQLPSSGGGGGGLYGGGGGGGGGDRSHGDFGDVAGAGGGGSSYVPEGGTSALTSAAASVSISWTLDAPTVTGTATTSAVVGQPVSDTATVSAGTGTVTFKLYRPGDTTCAQAPVFTSSDRPITAGSASSASYTPTYVGDFRWTASYSGDDDHAPAATTCGTAGQTSHLTAPAVQPGHATIIATLSLGGDEIVQQVYNRAVGPGPELTAADTTQTPQNDYVGNVVADIDPTNKTVTIGTSQPGNQNFDQITVHIQDPDLTTLRTVSDNFGENSKVAVTGQSGDWTLTWKTDVRINPDRSSVFTYADAPAPPPFVPGPLSLQTAPVPHLRGHMMSIDVTGFTPGETYQVKISGVVVAHGTADAKGEIHRKVRVPLRAHRPKAKLVVKGNVHRVHQLIRILNGIAD